MTYRLAINPLPYELLEKVDLGLKTPPHRADRTTYKLYGQRQAYGPIIPC